MMKFIIGKKSDVSATSDRSIWLLLLTALVAAVFAFAPVSAQVITDPNAPVRFTPSITSSGNGTRVINIPKPSKGGVSHSKFKEYNVDTSGVILNNSSLGGNSIIGGRIKGNKNIVVGKPARVILNEVTGSKKSRIAGPTEVFGTKADVIIANPNGLDCVGCTFINSGKITLSTGVPVPDYDKGTVGFETRKGEITISGEGLSAPNRERLDAVDIIGRTIVIDGTIRSRDKVKVRAGGAVYRADADTSAPIVNLLPSGATDAVRSTSSGVISAGSISILSKDLDIGVILDGHLQAGANDISIVSARDLAVKSSEAKGNITLEASTGRLSLSADQQANGTVSLKGVSIVGAENAGILSGAGISLDASNDISTRGPIKTGGSLDVEAGGDLSVSGLLVARDEVTMVAGGTLTSSSASIAGRSIALSGASAILDQTWVISETGINIAARDVTLDKATAFQAADTINVNAANELRIGTIINASDYPNLALSFKDLTVLDGGVIARPEIVLSVDGNISNSGTLYGTNITDLAAAGLFNGTTGVIYGGSVTINVTGDFENLGQLVSGSTLDIVTAGIATNSGITQAADRLTLRAVDYAANSQAAELVGTDVNIILSGTLSNSGLLLASGGSLSIVADGGVSNLDDGRVYGDATSVRSGAHIVNAGTLASGSDLTLVAATDIANTGDIKAVGLANITGGSYSAADKDSVLAANAVIINLSGDLNNDGAVSASSGELKVVLGGTLRNSATGTLFGQSADIDTGALENLGKLVSNSTLAVLVKGAAVNSGTIDATDSISLTANSFEGKTGSDVGSKSVEVALNGPLTNAGLIVSSDGNLSIRATDIVQATDGTLYGKAGLAITGANLNNAGGIASGNSLSLILTGNATNSGAIEAVTDIALTALRYEAKTNDSVLAAPTINIDVTDFDNEGLVTAFLGNGLTLNSGNFSNASGGIIQSDAISLTIAAATINNGRVSSTGDLNIASGGTLSNDGEIATANSITVDAAGYNSTKTTALLASKLVTLTLSGDFANAGEISADEGVSITQTSGDFNNSGSLLSSADITLTGSRNAINSGDIIAFQTLGFAASGSLRNSGKIASAEDLLLASDSLSNAGTLQAGTLLGITTKTVINNGSLIADGAVLKVDTETFENTSSGRIEASLAILRASQWISNAGDVRSTGIVFFDTASLTNNGRVEAATIFAGAGVSGPVNGYDLTTSYQLANMSLGATSQTIATDAVVIETDRLVQAAGAELASDQDLFLTLRVGDWSGSLSAINDLRLDVAGSINSSSVVAGNDLELIAGDDITNTLGEILVGNNMRLEAGGTISNLSGTIEAEGNIGIFANLFVNRALDGTSGSTVDFQQLSDWEFALANGRHGRRYGFFGPRRKKGGFTAYRYEDVGSIVVKQAALVRSGGDLLIETNRIQNEGSKILAVGNLTLNTASLLNDSQNYDVNRYRYNYGTGYSNGYKQFVAPPSWSNHAYSTGAIKDASINSVARGGARGIVIARGDIKLSLTGTRLSAGDLASISNVTIYENVVDIGSIVDLAALGIDPDNVPDVIYIGPNRQTALGSGYYSYQGRSYVGKTQVAYASLIKAGGDLSISAPSGAIDNQGTLSGTNAVIEAGTLINGVDPKLVNPVFVLGDVQKISVNLVTQGPVDTVSFTPGGDVTINGTVVDPLGTGLGDLSGSAVNVDGNASATVGFTGIAPADLAALPGFSGSLNPALLIANLGQIGQQELNFYSDPVAEARALADAATRATGSAIIIENAATEEEQRIALYQNALEFAGRTGARVGVALTEGQQAQLTKPIVWYERRIIDGSEILTPRLYVPSEDELQRGARGTGLIAATDASINVEGRLTNRGAIQVEDVATILAGSVLNERGTVANPLDSRSVLARIDSGLISAGSLYITTENDLINRGVLSSAFTTDIRTGGDFINEVLRTTRKIDGFDNCVGTCGSDGGISYGVAKVMSGGDLAIVSGGDIRNIGGKIGGVSDVVIAAGGEVEFTTLQDSFLQTNYKSSGFLSSEKRREYAIIASKAEVQSIAGDITIASGVRPDADGVLVATGDPKNIIANGAVISALGDTTLKASGDVKLDVVTTKVDNLFSKSGFQGLGWGYKKVTWNNVRTDVTEIYGNNVTIDAGRNVQGVAPFVHADGDLTVMADESIAFTANQNERYRIEKGFYIGLTFPGSQGVEALLNGRSTEEGLSGILQANPFYASLYSLANADNGVAAGFAAVNAVTSGVSIFGDASKAAGAADTNYSGDAFGSTIARKLNPFSGFFNDQGQLDIKGALGIRLSSWKNEQYWTESRRAELTAGGDAVLQAGLDVALLDGTRVAAAGDVTVDAGRDIILTALTDTVRDRSKSFGLSLSFSSISVDIAKAKGYDETLTNAEITGGGLVKLVSGRDTSILGGNVTGNRVELDVGRNLTVVSPQALGYRKGFTAGLTIGFGPTGISSIGIRGSKEKGDKAWTEPSSIVGVEGVDIRTEDTTRLVGALINATEGDVVLDTGRLELADLNDEDKYKKIGGGITIGISADALTADGVNFEYQNKQLEGVTRATIGEGEITIRDMDGDGIENEPEDIEQAETLIAAINRDPELFREITRDTNIDISGDLNLKNLRELPGNIKAIQDYVRATRAPVPADVAAGGPRAIDLYRKMIINGASVAGAVEASTTAEFQSLAGALSSYDKAVEHYGSDVAIPDGVRQLIALGQTVLFGKASQFTGGSVVVPCGANGRCEVELNEYLRTIGANPNAVKRIIAQAEGTLDAFLKSGLNDSLDIGTGGLLRVEHAFFNLLNCAFTEEAPEALRAAYQANPGAVRALSIGASPGFNGNAVIAAIESFSNSGNVNEYRMAMELAKYPPSTILSDIASLAKFGYELTPIADGVAVIRAISGGDIKGAMVAGVGFVPIAKAAKLVGKSVDAIQTSLRRGGDEAEEVVSQVRRNAINGAQFESAVISAMRGASKNTEIIAVTLPGGKVVRTIPDVLCASQVCEIKNVINLSNSNQLRAQLKTARDRGIPFDLVVSERNKTISKPVWDAIRLTGGSVQVFNSQTGVFRVIRRP